jgi:hypothetical protein
MLFKNHFHRQVKQLKKYCHGMSVTPSPPSLKCCQQNYIWVLKKLGHFEKKKILKTTPLSSMIVGCLKAFHHIMID